MSHTKQAEAAHPARECLQQIAAPAGVDALARTLFAAWAKAEPGHNVTQNPTSYLSTFADMARAALQAAPPAPAAVAVPTMNEAGYLPCPFCGSDDVSISVGEHGDGTPWHYVECGLCAAATEPDQWNTRAALAAAPAQAVAVPQVFALCESVEAQNAGATEFERGMRTAAKRIRKEVNADAPAQEDARDNERYRWLQECATEIYAIHKGPSGEILDFCWDCETDDQLSAAIDAARAAQKGQP